MSNKQIFISYRRSDSEDKVSHIYEHLVKAFGAEAVFRDVHSIPPGVDFRDHIKNAVDKCMSMLVVVGDTWMDVRDASGVRRLENPADWVRFEVGAGLAKKDFAVIPVFIKGVKGINPTELPDVLKDLAYRNAMKIRAGRDFENDMEGIINALERLGLPRITKPEDHVGINYQADFQGSGAIAKGDGTTAVGERGVNIGGDFSGSTIITGDNNKIDK